PFDLIKRGGGWKDRLGRLETHYLGFHLPRNNASPSLELQRMIFSWIEDYFGSKNEAWKKICEKEMREVDENEDDGISDDDYDENDNNVEFVDENGRIVQGSENSIVNSELPNEPKHNPFITTNFKELQEEIVNAINTPSVNRLQEYEGLVPNIVDSQMKVSNRLAEMNYKLTRDQQKNNDRLNTIENSLNKHHQDSSRIESILLGLSQQLQQVSYNQKILLTNQQALNSQVQLLMASNIPSNANINESNQAQSSFSSGSIHSSFQPLPPLPIPSQSLPSQPLSPLPRLTPTLLPPRPALPSPTPSSSETHHHPQVAIQPIASLANSIGSTSHLSTSKGKKRGRWVNYSVQHSP
ncbi:hypothetical protein INT45_003904, partial [Circinella minor]